MIEKCIEAASVRSETSTEAEDVGVSVMERIKRLKEESKRKSETLDRNSKMKVLHSEQKIVDLSGDEETEKESAEQKDENRMEVFESGNNGNRVVLGEKEIEKKRKEILYDASRKLGLQPVYPGHIKKHLKKDHCRDLNDEENEAGREAAAFEFLENELKFFSKIEIVSTKWSPLKDIL